MIYKTIATISVPKAIGPYSQAVTVNKFIFCSGQIALNPKSGELEGKTTGEQTRQVLTNLGLVLKAAGSSLEKVVKTTVYLKNINDFSGFNQVYAEFFPKNKPARATVEVSNLPKNALVEIDAVAVV
jgi:2-iminobutanoate/2-iminopropanoate deaminase